MKILNHHLALLIFAVACSPAFAQESTKTVSKDVEPQLRKELEKFAPFIGIWVIDGKWLSGEPIWAKADYKVGMDGNFVEALTFTKNEDGKVYQRYRTIWRWDADNSKIVAHGFTFDGTYSEIETKASTTDGKNSLTSRWTPPGSPSEIKQVVTIIDDSKYSWKVWMIGGEGDNQLMDGVWKKQTSK